MSSKSFYDLDYIIEINEKRAEQYTAAYQKVLERLTNIIIVYSAIAIFLIPIIQDIFLCEGKWFLRGCFIVFAILFITSLVFTVRLIIPVEVTYLSAPKRYYEEYRLQYEQSNNNNQVVVENLLKASYINELERNLHENELVFRRKSSFYYNALMYSLLSTIPYLFCFGFYITKKEESIQKVEVVNKEKNSNLQSNSVMADSTNTNSSTTTPVTTNLPGVNNAQVIPSSPIYIKENSQTPTVKDTTAKRKK
jgi:hypothetical protein